MKILDDMKYLLAFAIPICAISCSKEDTIGSRSNYSHEEVQDLEIKATLGDVEALKNLRSHYDIEANYKDRDRIDAILLKLGDPESIEFEIYKLIYIAEQSSKCPSKLEKYRIAKNYAKQLDFMNDSRSGHLSMSEYVNRSMRQSGC